MNEIAVVIPRFALVGGAERFACRLTEEMIPLGYRFHVLAHRWKKEDYPVTFHRTGYLPFPRFLITPSFAWNVAKRVKKGDFDLIHSHDRIFSADIFTLHGVPHLFWAREVRGKKVLSLFDWATAWVEREMVTRNPKSFFVAVSEITKSLFLDVYKIDRSRVPVIHPGVDLPTSQEGERKKSRNYLASRYGIENRERILFFAAMNFEIKGLKETIAALGTLARKEPAFKLLIAGKGNRKHYERLAYQEGIGGKVIFTGVLDKETLSRHYWGSDLFLLLSHFDTFGLVVLEAMAHGLPVMVSSRVGAKDVIVEGENGFIISDISNGAEIATKIMHIFRESKHRLMSEAAHETAKRCSWKEVAKKYHKLYQSVLHAKA